MSLNEVVDEALRQWWARALVPGEDPNVDDLLILAEVFHNSLNLELGSPSLSVEQYASIIKTTGDIMLGKSAMRIHYFMRCRKKEILLNELTKLGGKIIEINQDFGSEKVSIMQALYLYWSYLKMAKICREQTGQGKPIILDERLKVYFEIISLAKTNLWIRSGIIMVRIRPPPYQKMVIDWIHKDSLYYEEL